MKRYLIAAVAVLALAVPAGAETLKLAVGQRGGQFFPKAAIDPDVIHGLDTIIAEGVRLKSLGTPLTPEQVKQVMAVDRLR